MSRTPVQGEDRTGEMRKKKEEAHEMVSIVSCFPGFGLFLGLS
jgi:hypothetical protein